MDRRQILKAAALGAAAGAAYPLADAAAGAAAGRRRAAGPAPALPRLTVRRAAERGHAEPRLARHLPHLLVRRRTRPAPTWASARCA